MMIEVGGCIKDLLVEQHAKEYLKDIDDIDSFISSMVDAPIMFDGKPIGVINSIDDECECWSGVIWCDPVLCVDSADKYVQCITLKKGY